VGPLAGVRIVEILGIGPGPFAGMMLADMGAEVTAVTRPGGFGDLDFEVDITRRGKRFVELDLKAEAGRAALLDLVRDADALFEGFRPGVMERLGLGPEDLRAVNRRLVYGRITGWGQEGPLARVAGHDLTYAAVAGAIHPIGPADRPPSVPLNLVADFGGGGMLLVAGLLAALLEAGRTGEGRVVDAAMVDGASLLMTMFHSLHASGRWRDAREANFLDGGAPFYRCYATRDGRFMAVAAIEAGFWRIFVERMGLGPDWVARQNDPEAWPGFRAELEARFAARDQADWVALFEGTDACVAPVLPFREAPEHPQAVARGAFIEREGVVEPAPAPRFSRPGGG